MIPLAPIPAAALIAYQRIQPTNASTPSRRSSEGDAPNSNSRRADRITLSAESIALWEAAIGASRATPTDEDD
jgi:hypothetical protein